MRSNSSTTEIVEPHIAQFNMKIDGSQAPPEVMDDLLECTVENSLHLPDMCTIRMHDHEFKWLDSDKFQEGKRIQIEGGEGTRELSPLFDGEIVGLEMDLAAHGVSTLTLRCLDKSHRLQRGRLSRSFVNVKDSDLVQKIGREMGMQVKAESTKVVHDWVLQNNQTNWEFLSERAAKNGFRLYLKGEKELIFEKVKDSGSNVVDIEWGKELLSFRPRTSASSQVDEVEVRGWDPKQKRAIVENVKTASGIPKVGRPAKGGDIAKRAFGKAKHTIVDRPVHSHIEAKELAQSISDEIAGSYLEAEGLCTAMPKLKPGMNVKIKNIGKRFSGEYLVSSTVHTYTPSEGYATQFVISGKHPQNLVASLGGGGGANPHSVARRTNLGGNVVIGIVTDNKDPEGLGRVKVKYPWLTEDHGSYWARQASQMAGSGRGMFNIPEIDDEVLIAFEHGDVTRPFLLGQLWNGKDKMPSPTGARTTRPSGPAAFAGKGGPLGATNSNNPVLGGGGEVNRRGLYSRIGHLVDIDDTGGKGGVMVKSAGGNHIDISDADKKIELKTPGGHSAILDDTGKKIELKSTSGHTITMDDASNMISIVDNAGDRIDMVMGAISIVGLMAVSITAPMISMNAGVMLTGQSEGVVNFMSGFRSRFTSTGTITLDATDDMNVKSGATINTEAGADIKTKAGGDMDLKATTIKLNS